MNVAVIGTGYVGLVTGLCLTELGHNVGCMDQDEEKIQMLSNGQTTFFEEGIEDMLARNLGKNIVFTTELNRAVESAQIIMIAVGTPAGKNGHPDIESVVGVCMDIAKIMKEDKIIIIKSTVPTGTCRMLKDKMGKQLLKRMKKAGEELTVLPQIEIVSNPEFLRQGSAYEDFMRPDRIVVGLDKENGDPEIARLRPSQVLRELYEPFIQQGVPYIETSLETSEMIKYAANAFLAAKISYINELAIICESCGADIGIVSLAMGLDKRIGNEFLKPGPGYGGSCFPKDTMAFLHIGKKAGHEPGIVKATVEANRNQIRFVMKKLERLMGKVSGRTIAILGLSFKPGTDDLREAPSMALIRELLKEKAILRVYDPKAMTNFAKAMEGAAVKNPVACCDSAAEACKDSECIVVMTDWPEFAKLDAEEIGQAAGGRIVIDARNMLEPDMWRSAGFVYEGVGIPASPQG